MTAQDEGLQEAAADLIALLADEGVAHFFINPGHAGHGLRWRRPGGRATRGTWEKLPAGCWARPPRAAAWCSMRGISPDALTRQAAARIHYSVLRMLLSL
ncbi:MAG TPA: hypothetical protein VMU34_07975 [Mycobacterium sp.]|nr:hypothetical protein [Mycobacterium sp.]